MKTITSSVAFTDPQNNIVANGILTLDLSQPCEITSGGGQVGNRRVTITLTAAGLIPASTSIWANDQLTPSGTTYHSQLFDSNGNKVADFGQWTIAGTSPIDLSQMTPSITGVAYPVPVLQQPSAAQVINGQTLTLEGAPLGFSATGSPTPDTGISRDTPGVIDIGNGTQGDKSGAINAANETLTGVLTLAAGSAAATTIRRSGSGANNGFWFPANNWLAVSNTGTNTAAMGQQFVISSSSIFGFSNGGAWTGNFDGGFSRLAAAKVALGNGTVGDSSGTLVLSAIQGPGFKQQIFNSSGTFTIPAGITQVKVTVVGGGGAGGGGTSGGQNGYGGGSGGCSIKWLTGLTSGNTLTVTVGAGGAGVSAASGGNGSSSSVASGTQSITTITANGALGGGPGNGSGSGGGPGSGGDLNFGGTAGTSDNSAGNSGTGAGSIFGGGGQPTGNSNVNGNPGTAPGAGGSGGHGGASNTSGGAGANGIVTFEWLS